MITPSDSFNTAEFKNYFIIYPQSNFSDWSLEKYIKNNKEKNFNKVKIGFTYNSKSNKHFLSVLNIFLLIIVFGLINLIISIEEVLSKM